MPDVSSFVAPADPPRTPAHRINREVAVLLGWPAAVLMQLAHPLVLQGVLDHSVFVADSGRRAERLRCTVQSMLLLSFGNEREVQATADTINGIHDHIHGHLPESAGSFHAGTVYSAHDPALLRWVHVTLLDVLPRTYELFVGPLPPAARAAYYSDAAVMERLLGIPHGYLPRTGPDMQRQLEATLASGDLAVTPAGRGLAAALLAPQQALPGPVRWLLPASGLPGLVTRGLLPPAIRAAYGWRWTHFDDALLRVLAAICRGALKVLPPAARFWRHPSRWSVRRVSPAVRP